jgi:hypothetical protein
MSDHEEELQRKVESGELLPADSADVRAYQHVFDALRKEPHYVLHHSFADNVVQKILAQKLEKKSSSDFWWLGAGIFLLVIAFLVSLSYIISFVRLPAGFLSALSEYKGIIVIAGTLVFIFNKLEKKLLTHKHTNSPFI